MNLAKLKPGDCLLYNGQSFYSYLIKLKTWNRITHCEMYFVNGTTLASREGQGVNFYEFREPYKVLRPRYPVDMIAVMNWFHSVQNQKYDWLGLLRFVFWDTIPTKDNSRQFCSEFLTRAYRAGGLDPFNGKDADLIAPWFFELSDKFEEVNVS